MIGRVLFLVAITIPITTYANIEITEIMYDLEGVDAEREWVEIYNAGVEDVDLTGWRFNDGKNHVLNPPPLNGGQGSMNLLAGAYAILASDAGVFLSEHNIGGVVIDTVMSLNNTEDTISLLDSNGIIVDEVSYTSDLGGAGDGKSLQLFSFGWRSDLPTLFTDGGDAQGEPGTKDTQIENKNKTIYAKDPYLEPQIRADSGEDVFGVVSSMLFFEGHAYGLKGNLLTDAHFLWNFGDGKYKKGQNVTHTYLYPGTYRVSLTVSSGEFSNIDRKIVEIRTADVEITYADKGRIEISNYSDLELDLSYWKIKYKDVIFNLPKGMYILEKSKGIFPSSTTNISVLNLEELSLLYPNGIVASAFLVPVENLSISNEVIVVAKQSYTTTYFEEESKKISEKEEKEIVATSTLQIASPSKIVEPKNSRGNLYKWLLALVSIISVASLLVLSRDRSSTDKELKAKNFKIVD